MHWLACVQHTLQALRHQISGACILDEERLVFDAPCRRQAQPVIVWGLMLVVSTLAELGAVCLEQRAQSVPSRGVLRGLESHQGKPFGRGGRCAVLPVVGQFQGRLQLVQLSAVDRALLLCCGEARGVRPPSALRLQHDELRERLLHLYRHLRCRGSLLGPLNHHEPQQLGHEFLVL